MRAMVLEGTGRPLEFREMPPPEVGTGQVLLRVRACGVCRTDLHILDGELSEPKLPLVLGHQIVGEVVEVDGGVDGLERGDRVGVPWLGWTCGVCRYCTSGRENLCPRARFTGYDVDGGFAELVAADARYCFPVPESYPDEQAAPLLCAGLIGWRSLGMVGDAELLGLYGFGNSARLVAQVARHQGRRVFAFTKPDDERSQRVALELGCEWAGPSTQMPPEQLDAAICFAAVGDLVPFALRAVVPGGSVVCAEIHMSDIPSFPYEILWGERILRSVANLTRQDGGFLEIAAEIPVRTRVQRFSLEQANAAIVAARSGGSGTPVLVIAGG
jgi:propanol-preferring alcohol dehydrogenase